VEASIKEKSAIQNRNFWQYRLSLV